MLSPNTVDSYSRFMDEMFDERELIAVDTVWQSFFGNPASGGSKTVYSPDSEVVDIDVIRADGEKYAKMIHRGTNSRFLNMQKNVSDLNWSTFSRVYPLCEELSDITASQINKRMPGENPYERMDRQSRMREYARKFHAEHIRRYVRLFEVLSGLSLLGGAHPALLGDAASANTDNWYDFRRNASLIVSPTVPWDDAAADILGDWDAAFQTGREIGKVRYDMAIAGANVLPVILNDATIQKFADNRGFQMIRAGENNWSLPARYQRFVDAGLTPIAWFMTPRGRTFYLFGYDGIVTDDDGEVQYLMPQNGFFFAYSGARCDRYFGPGEVLPADPITQQLYSYWFGMDMSVPMIPAKIKNPSGIVTPQMFHCDAYAAGDNKKVTIRTQAAPIFATTQTDAFFTFHHCLTVSS
jgi:hypothetical protein